MLHVVKRDGRKVDFDSVKITNAIKSASEEIGRELKESEFIDLTQEVIQHLEKLNLEEIDVEDIQNVVEKVLMKRGYLKIGLAYSNYRKERNDIREIKSDLMKTIDKIGIQTDRDNANVGNNFSAKLLRIASESNKWHNLATMPKYLARDRKSVV